MYAAVAVESVYACVSLWQCVYLNAQSDSVRGSGSAVTLASVHACVNGCVVGPRERLGLRVCGKGPASLTVGGPRRKKCVAPASRPPL